MLLHGMLLVVAFNMCSLVPKIDVSAVHAQLSALLMSLLLFGLAWF